MKIRAQALRLALLVEASSLLVFFGEHSRTASNILFDWFAILNMPTIFLFRSHVWESVGRDTLFPAIGLIIVAVQTVVWFFLWYALLLGIQKLRARRRASNAA